MQLGLGKSAVYVYYNIIILRVILKNGLLLVTSCNNNLQDQDRDFHKFVNLPSYASCFVDLTCRNEILILCVRAVM